MVAHQERFGCRTITRVSGPLICPIFVCSANQTASAGTDRAEQLRVEECGGHVLNGRVSGMLAVTRALGDHMLKGQPPRFGFILVLIHCVNLSCRPGSVTSEPFFHEIALAPDDRWLIVACDGLWDVVTDAEAVAHIQECQSASDACEPPFATPSPPSSCLLCFTLVSVPFAPSSPSSCNLPFRPHAHAARTRKENQG